MHSQKTLRRCYSLLPEAADDKFLLGLRGSSSSGIPPVVANGLFLLELSEQLRRLLCGSPEANLTLADMEIVLPDFGMEEISALGELLHSGSCRLRSRPSVSRLQALLTMLDLPVATLEQAESWPPLPPDIADDSDMGPHIQNGSVVREGVIVCGVCKKNVRGPSDGRNSAKYFRRKHLQRCLARHKASERDHRGLSVQEHEEEETSLRRVLDLAKAELATAEGTHRLGRKRSRPPDEEDVRQALAQLGRSCFVREGERIRCGVCGKTFGAGSSSAARRSILGRIRHFRQTHFDKIHGKRTSEEEKEAHFGFFSCHLCQRDLPSGFAVERHVIQEHVEKSGAAFACPDCPVTFAHFDQAVAHSAECHQRPEPAKCRICQKRLSHVSRLPHHFTASHVGQACYDCPRCGETFFTRKTAKSHLVKVHGGGRIKCPLCDQTASSMENLRRHSARKHPEQALLKFRNLLSCPVCQQLFATRSYLQEHMSLHNGRPAYLCSICGQGFCGKDGLRKHSRTLHGETND